MIELVVVGALATNCWIYAQDSAASGDQDSAAGGDQDSAAGGDQDSAPDGTRDSAPGGALGECAVIDPGADADVIIARLEQLRLRPRYILLTHGHFDHIAALPALAAYAGDPVIGIHRDDRDYLGAGARQVHRASFSALAGNAAAYVDALWEAMPDATVSLEEGSVIGPLVTLHLPGHSPGSAAFYDRSAGVLFSGDTLFQGGYGRTDLPGGSWPQLRQSLSRLFTLDRGIGVYPGHGGTTTIGEASDALQ